jgi:hypothetical protein
MTQRRFVSGSGDVKITYLHPNDEYRTTTVFSVSVSYSDFTATHTTKKKHCHLSVSFGTYYN